MSEQQPPAPGWWQAADGGWHPPASTVPRDSAESPPIEALPPVVSPQGGGQGGPPRPWYRSRAALAAGVLTVVLLIAGVIALSGGSDKENVASQVDDAITTTTLERSTTTSMATTTSAPTTTTEAPVQPSPPSATLSGNQEVVPPGSPGKVEVVLQSAIDGAHRVAVVIRNNTSDTLPNLEVSAVARDGAGTLVGSGRSLKIAPALVTPGGVAIGFVFFSEANFGADATFEFTINAGSPNVFVDLAVPEVTTSGSSVVGRVVNDSGVSVQFASAISVCFDRAGSPTQAGDDFTTPKDLAPGGQASFQTDMVDRAVCTKVLTGAIGHPRH